MPKSSARTLLTMDYLPAYYRKNSCLQIHISDGETVSVIVEKAITPLTTSQVLVVHVGCPCNNITPSNVSYALPSTTETPAAHIDAPASAILPKNIPILLKICDSRFTSSRFRGILQQPWSYELEVAAAESLRTIPDRRYPNEDVPKPIFNERNLQINTIDAWSTEIEAYQRLQPLQGSAIPRFYLSGTFIPPDTPRAVHIGAIFLEYIPNAISLANCAPELFTVQRARTFIRIIREMHHLGVIHNDVHANNYLITPRRDCIIDFGSAAIRGPNEDDKHWLEAVDEIGDVNGFKFVIKRKMKWSKDQLGILLP